MWGTCVTTFTIKVPITINCKQYCLKGQKVVHTPAKQSAMKQLWLPIISAYFDQYMWILAYRGLCQVSYPHLTWYYYYYIDHPEAAKRFLYSLSLPCLVREMDKRAWVHGYWYRPQAPSQGTTRTIKESRDTLMLPSIIVKYFVVVKMIQLTLKFSVRSCTG